MNREKFLQVIEGKGEQLKSELLTITKTLEEKQDQNMQKNFKAKAFQIKENDDVKYFVFKNNINVMKSPPEFLYAEHSHKTKSDEKFAFPNIHLPDHEPPQQFTFWEPTQRNCIVRETEMPHYVPFLDDATIDAELTDEYSEITKKQAEEKRLNEEVILSLIRRLLNFDKYSKRNQFITLDSLHQQISTTSRRFQFNCFQHLIETLFNFDRALFETRIYEFFDVLGLETGSNGAPEDDAPYDNSFHSLFCGLCGYYECVAHSEKSYAEGTLEHKSPAFKKTRGKAYWDKIRCKQGDQCYLLTGRNYDLEVTDSVWNIQDTEFLQAMFQTMGEAFCVMGNFMKKPCALVRAQFEIEHAKHPRQWTLNELESRPKRKPKPPPISISKGNKALLMDRCRCSARCNTNACPCFLGNRECKPDACITCHVNAPLNDRNKCRNAPIVRMERKHLILAPSDIAGNGMFLHGTAEKGEFIYEYCGEGITQLDADKRGRCYDKQICSFLFNLTDDLVIDAKFKGNKIRFANHSTIPNCSSKIVTINGSQRIRIYATKKINRFDEIFFDYGYNEKLLTQFTNVDLNADHRDPAKVAADRKKHHEENERKKYRGGEKWITEEEEESTDEESDY